MPMRWLKPIHRNVVFEQRARLRPPVHPRPQRLLIRPQRRSICRALMRSRARSVAGVSRKRRRPHGTHAGSSAFSRTDQG